MAQHEEQLSMVAQRDKALALPDLRPSDGYNMRRYQPGDESAWVALLVHGSFGEWSVERFDTYIQGLERTEGSYVVVRDGALVAATFASVQPDVHDVGRLDFVVSHTGHRGNGLGRVVCTAVMKHLARRGYESTILFTDDWRLPAIGLYLSLGFAPRMTGEDMPDRWDVIMQTLDESR